MAVAFADGPWREKPLLAATGSDSMSDAFTATLRVLWSCSVNVTAGVEDALESPIAQR